MGAGWGCCRRAALTPEPESGFVRERRDLAAQGWIPAPECPHPGSDGTIWQVSPISRVLRCHIRTPEEVLTSAKEKSRFGALPPKTD
jgi:hypothetical protein